MKCVSCGADIPPAFVHAIQINQCPGCSGPIMTEESKKLLDELKDAMSKMPNDPEGLAGWLLSTYDLFPKGTVAPTNFHRAQAQQQGPGPMIGPDGQPLRWANSPTAKVNNKFAQRAGLDRMMTDPKRAELTAMINDINASAGANMYGDGQEVDQEPTLEEKLFMQQQELEEMRMRAATMGNNGRMTAKELLAKNVDFTPLEGGNVQISQDEVAALQHVWSGTATNMDAQDRIPELQKDRMKRMMSQDAVLSGGNGAFRRGG